MSAAQPKLEYSIEAPSSQQAGLSPAEAAGA